MSSTFDNDLERAHLHEAYIAERFVSQWGYTDVCKIPVDCQRLGDIQAQSFGGTITFELKEDMLCAETGNVAIEFECSGKPSGIVTSDARYWFITAHQKEEVHHMLYLTDRLRRLVCGRYYSRELRGGDDGAAGMYLFDLSVMLTNADKVVTEPIGEYLEGLSAP